jgi:hypothetical protein
MLYVIVFVGVRVTGNVVAMGDIDPLLLGVSDHIEDTLSVGVKGHVVGIADTDLVSVADIVELVAGLAEAVLGHEVAIGELVNVLAAEVGIELSVIELVVVLDCERLELLLIHAFGEILNTALEVSDTPVDGVNTDVREADGATVVEPLKLL